MTGNLDFPPISSRTSSSSHTLRESFPFVPLENPAAPVPGYLRPYAYPTPSFLSGRHFGFSIRLVSYLQEDLVHSLNLQIGFPRVVSHNLLSVSV